MDYLSEGEEFINNNRGINDGKDLPVEYLTNLYEGDPHF